MSTPLLGLEEQFEHEMLHLIAAGNSITLTAKPYALFALISLAQLGSRHPDTSDNVPAALALAMLEQWVETAYADHPAVRQIATMGFDRANDGTVGR